MTARAIRPCYMWTSTEAPSTRSRIRGRPKSTAPVPTTYAHGREETTDTERSPDPVRDPKAYQDHLLGLLGDEDPALVLAGTPATLGTIAADAGADLPTRPEPTEWSVLECIAHLVDAEIVMSGRYRFVIAHDEPALPGYDQDLWVDRLHSKDEDVEPLLRLFEALRTANVALWNGSTQEQRDRIGVHAERGPESFELAFRMMAGHDRFHIAQAERALRAIRRVG
jgi:hypothetical protein